MHGGAVTSREGRRAPFEGTFWRSRATARPRSGLASLLTRLASVFSFPTRRQKVGDSLDIPAVGIEAAHSQSLGHQYREP